MRPPLPGGARSLPAFLALLLFLPTVRGDVTGTVILQGKPNSRDETFYARANGCGESPMRKTENWKVGEKGELADVIVWIVDPKFGPSEKPAAPIEIRQIGCRYIPHVVAVQAGVPFKVINGDPTIHNVHAKISNGADKPAGADVFNFGQVRQGQTDDRKFDDAGLYTLQCEVHSWMQCWVMALPVSVFGVSQPDGSFDLAGSGQLADGTYTLKAWHPRFSQPLEQKVEVKGGKALVNLQFDGAKSF